MRKQRIGHRLKLVTIVYVQMAVMVWIITIEQHQQQQWFLQ